MPFLPRKHCEKQGVDSLFLTLPFCPTTASEAHLTSQFSELIGFYAFDPLTLSFKLFCVMWYIWWTIFKHTVHYFPDGLDHDIVSLATESLDNFRNV